MEEDYCVVCTEALEWVAYGSCGHREVCSTCVARLRFVMDDKKCCICKTVCPFVFVTKVRPSRVCSLRTVLVPISGGGAPLDLRVI
jgi:hypothetical protein